MTTLVTADEKGRIPVRGSEPGRKYLVSSEGGEWRVTPYSAQKICSRNKRQAQPLKGKGSLLKALRDLGDAGLVLTESDASRQPVPPCRF